MAKTKPQIKKRIAGMAFSQIFILVLATVAIAALMGETEQVNAAGEFAGVYTAPDGKRYPVYTDDYTGRVPQNALLKRDIPPAPNGGIVQLDMMARMPPEDSSSKTFSEWGSNRILPPGAPTLVQSATTTTSSTRSGPGGTTVTTTNTQTQVQTAPAPSQAQAPATVSATPVGPVSPTQPSGYTYATDKDGKDLFRYPETGKDEEWQQYSNGKWGPQTSEEMRIHMNRQEATAFFQKKGIAPPNPSTIVQDTNVGNPPYTAAQPAGQTSSGVVGSLGGKEVISDYFKGPLGPNQIRTTEALAAGGYTDLKGNPVVPGGTAPSGVKVTTQQQNGEPTGMIIDEQRGGGGAAEEEKKPDKSALADLAKAGASVLKKNAGIGGTATGAQVLLEQSGDRWMVENGALAEGKSLTLRNLDTGEQIAYKDLKKADIDNIKKEITGTTTATKFEQTYGTQQVTLADGKTTKSLSSLTKSEYDAMLAKNKDALADTNVKEIKYNADGTKEITNKDGKINTVSATGAVAAAGQEFDWGTFGSHLGEGIVWAGIAAGVGAMIGSFMGLSSKQTTALSAALAAGTFAGKAVYGAFAAKGLTSTGYMLGAIGAGVAVAAVIFVLMYKKEKTKEAQFTCKPWQAPIGGKDCEKCNNNPFVPCSEYRCRSLGQACQLLNKDKPGQETCAWVGRNDVNSPIIQVDINALKPLDLKYTPDKAVRPGMLGFKIVKPTAPDTCLQAFTALQFGITTNEPAQCKLDWNHTSSFEKMEYDFGGTTAFGYNHTQIMRLPGANVTEGENPIFKNDGTTTMFIRCRDANNNSNVDEFAVSFCVSKSPDTTPPLVVSSSLVTNSFVQFNVSSVPIEVYMNEPSECKWDIQSRDFDTMANNMTCATDPGEINAQLTYTCIGDLTGVKNMEDNPYYFRCKDNPGAEESERNVMTQSYEIVLKGSQPLNILSIAPNETVYGSTDVVELDLEVETDDGAEEGRAICSFSQTTDIGSFVEMTETNNFRHKQTLTLGNGVYTFYVRCLDAGGNVAMNSTTFIVVVDKQAPFAARAYYEEGMGLKIVTNEDADCAYSLNNCNFIFEEGIKAVHSNPDRKQFSYIEWKPNTVFYVKCLRINRQAGRALSRAHSSGKHSSYHFFKVTTKRKI